MKLTQASSQHGRGGVGCCGWSAGSGANLMAHLYLVDFWIMVWFGTVQPNGLGPWDWSKIVTSRLA